ncbi:MAG: TRZ/ATZ family hydrolase [Gammaproteobacteria bacterium]|nr:TRZ/ATZ family hydrolase [Gammaproteobacteria bacterium]
MQIVDRFIHAAWVITCNDAAPVLDNHTLCIKDDKIIDILPTATVDDFYQALAAEYYSTHAVLPGFINAHTHAAMNLFRGLADDLELMDWLKQYIWPAEEKWVSHDFVYDGTTLAIAEMIRSGTTCFNDMYFYLNATADAVIQSGIRAGIGITVINVPTAWAKTPDEYFAKGLAFFEEYKNHENIIVTLAPHSTYTVSEHELIKVKTLADQYQLRVNIHLQEAISEIIPNQLRPLHRLNNIGLVNDRLIAIHMTQIDQSDMEILQEKKPNIVHCPESNLKIVSGSCPVQQLLNANINVALGTDGAASNNDLNMMGEMRTAAFLGKMTADDPKALSAYNVLKMATRHGAKALGIDHITGSLEKGKSADFIAINLNAIETAPVYHPISQIVYAADRTQVTDVWVRGKQLLKNRELTTLDEAELLRKAQSWREKIKN